jgi:hypothetical protein
MNLSVQIVELHQGAEGAYWADMPDASDPAAAARDALKLARDHGYGISDVRVRVYEGPSGSAIGRVPVLEYVS